MIFEDEGGQESIDCEPLLPEDDGGESQERSSMQKNRLLIVSSPNRQLRRSLPQVIAAISAIS
jgi:hypothetical protein